MESNNMFVEKTKKQLIATYDETNINPSGRVTSCRVDIKNNNDITNRYNA